MWPEMVRCGAFHEIAQQLLDGLRKILSLPGEVIWSRGSWISFLLNVSVVKCFLNQANLLKALIVYTLWFLT